MVEGNSKGSIGLFYQRFLLNVSVPIQLHNYAQRIGLVEGGAFETPLPERPLI